MKKIFITATNTDIGKTYITLKLLRYFAQKGFRVGAIKPIETGVNDTPLDGLKLLSMQQTLNKELNNLTMSDVVPITFVLPAAPFIASKAQEIDLKPIFNAIKKFEPLCDILLIEGAGGLYVPINKNYFMIDLIKELHVDETFLVTHCDLGCINDTLLSKKALKDAQLKHNVIFNCKNGTESFQKVSKPFFDAINFEHFEFI
jgi:dethiobiotin synthetase